MYAQYGNQTTTLVQHRTTRKETKRTTHGTASWPSCWLQHRPRHDRSTDEFNFLIEIPQFFFCLASMSFHARVCASTCLGYSGIFAVVAILNKIYSQFSSVKFNLFYNNFFPPYFTLLAAVDIQFGWISCSLPCRAFRCVQ